MIGIPSFVGAIWDVNDLHLVQGICLLFKNDLSISLAFRMKVTSQVDTLQGNYLQGIFQKYYQFNLLIMLVHNTIYHRNFTDLITIEIEGTEQGTILFMTKLKCLSFVCLNILIYRNL